MSNLADNTAGRGVLDSGLRPKLVSLRVRDAVADGPDFAIAAKTFVTCSH
jgi:hypothetical protein